MTPRYLILFILLLLQAVCYSQHSSRFSSYTVNDGLPQSSIDEMIQDKAGFLWVGTAGGLCRFDGYSFKDYKRNLKDSTAVSGDKGFHFYNDKSGQLWVLHYNGINMYNARTDKFTNIFYYTPQNTVTIKNHFYGEDDQFIWAALCSYGIVKINKLTHEVIKLKLKGIQQAKANTLWYNGFMENGKLWIATNNELNNAFFIYDTKNETTDTIHIPVTDIIQMNSNLLLGINTKAVVLINKKTFAYQLIDITGDGSESNITNIYRISDTAALLCSTTKGLFYFNTVTKKLSNHITDHILNNEEKKPIHAYCAYFDRSGNLWIGTSSEGLQKLTYPFKKFNLYQSPNSKSNNVKSIFTNGDKIYISSYSNGIDLFSKKDGFVKNIPVNKNNYSIVNNAQLSNSIFNNQLVFLANNIYSNGYNIPLSLSFDKEKIQLLDSAVQKAFSKYWGKGNLRQFACKVDENDLLINVGEYLLSLKLSGNKVRTEIVNRFEGDILACCYKDEDGTVWVGTYHAVYFYRNGIWKKLNMPVSKEIKGFAKDKAGNIWIGTPEEVYVVDIHQKFIHHYTEENGLINGHIYAMLSDTKGNIWFSHNKGLTVYMVDKNKFRHYSKDDGLQSDEFNASASFKAADGELFFGGINGTNSFYPEEILDNPNTPPVKITSIKLFDEPFKTDSAYWNIHSLTLPYTDNSLSFEFALPEFTNPQKNQYAYMMEGIDKNWINAGDRRFARYPGMAAGNYSFKVKASNNDGVWNDVPATITVTIIPPIWKRIWFIVLANALLIGFIVATISYFQKMKFRRQMQAIEVQYKIQSERDRISRDLHDNVGTQLSLINKNIQVMLADDIPVDEKYKKLASVNQSSQDVISSLRETIWALNKEELSIQEFFDKLKSFTQKQAALNTQIQLHFTESEHNNQLMLGPAEVLNLFRICQEAITNSLKYSNASLLQVDLNVTGYTYNICISDNGIGFDAESINTAEHYGLENMKFRANDINCSLEIAATEKGTIVMIRKK